MKTRKSNPIPKYKTVGRYDGFSVTEEVFHACGRGKMVCLTTGELADPQELKRRGKGTWLKVTQEV
jgi:hypothetical protein